MAEGDRFHRQVFERISDEKRERIFAAAISEFAEQGYVAANINTIAEKAEISIGAMYRYFQSKEDLFLAMAEKGIAIFQQVLAEVGPPEQDFFSTIEQLFRLTIRYAREHADLCCLYLELSTEQMGPLTERLSEKMEVDFHRFYAARLERARASGEIRSDVDNGLIGVVLDELVILLQFGFSSTYHRMRLQQYVGALAEDEEGLVEGLMRLVRSALAPAHN